MGMLDCEAGSGIGWVLEHDVRARVLVDGGEGVLGGFGSGEDCGVVGLDDRADGFVGSFVVEAGIDEGEHAGLGDGHWGGFQWVG